MAAFLPPLPMPSFSHSHSSSKSSKEGTPEPVPQPTGRQRKFGAFMQLFKPDQVDTPPAAKPEQAPGTRTRSISLPTLFSSNKAAPIPVKRRFFARKISQQDLMHPCCDEDRVALSSSLPYKVPHTTILKRRISQTDRPVVSFPPASYNGIQRHTSFTEDVVVYEFNVKSSIEELEPGASRVEKLHDDSVCSRVSDLKAPKGLSLFSDIETIEESESTNDSDENSTVTDNNTTTNGDTAEIFQFEEEVKPDLNSNLQDTERTSAVSTDENTTVKPKTDTRMSASQHPDDVPKENIATSSCTDTSHVDVKKEADKAENVLKNDNHNHVDENCDLKNKTDETTVINKQKTHL